MKAVIFFPPAGRVTGGMAVLLQLGLALKGLGREVEYCLWDEKQVPYLEKQGFRTRVGRQLSLGAEDVFLIPEGWPNALAMGINSRARCFVYCQNWAYLFGGLPGNVNWNDLPVEFISVSEPVRNFIHEVLGKESQVIRPFIDKSIFFPGPARSGNVVNIACMPRKNKALISLIKRIINSRNPEDQDIRWISIDGADHPEVAGLLRDSHIFLASGFPEGFALPPLEAMACGCLVVGYAGLGGWDYMRPLQGSFVPDMELRRVEWEGNGLYNADGDVLGTALSLEKAVQMFRASDSLLTKALENCRLTADSYSRENQEKEVFGWLKQL
ncbi:MAG: glycosyltransferase [Desulfonatronovibrionaceae bacterium]